MRFIKKYLLLIFFISIMNYSQVENVEVSNPVYNFLERISSLHLIENYNSFELPKSRKEITNYLAILIEKKSELSKTDRKILSDLLIEFQYDIFGNTQDAINLFPNFNLFSHIPDVDKQKYLYHFYDSTNFNLFSNFEGELENLNLENITDDKNTNCFLARYALSLRGSFYNKIGYYARYTIGTYFGDKPLALTKNNLKQNYKFTRESTSNSGSEFYDEAEGSITADFDFVRFSIGRERKNIGYGNFKSILSNNPPQFNYVALDLKYSFFNFSFFHGNLIGTETNINDSLQGQIREVTEKFFSYHRIGFNISKHLQIGGGEIVIYSRRGLDISYLNPFNFYKSTEHANLDRDNTMLFLDLMNNSIKGLKFYGTLLIDDMDFGKFGTSWYGNMTVLNLGAYATFLNKYLPMDFSLQFLQIQPYTYTHRIQDNNFTSQNFSLCEEIPPNSETYYFSIDYRPFYRMQISAAYRYTIHGANEVDSLGNVKKNNGGDILVGHRPFDDTIAPLLNGPKEYFHTLSFLVNYEIANDIFIHLNVNYFSEKLQNQITKKNLITSLMLFLKI